jgi:hypothetical protein
LLYYVIVKQEVMVRKQNKKSGKGLEKEEPAIKAPPKV